VSVEQQGTGIELHVPRVAAIDPGRGGAAAICGALLANQPAEDGHSCTRPQLHLGPLAFSWS
jgi:hypothetical protein